MSQKDWDKALDGLPARLCSWMGDDAPKGNDWVGKLTGITFDKDINEWVVTIVIDGEKKSREAGWGQIRPE